MNDIRALEIKFNLKEIDEYRSSTIWDNRFGFQLITYDDTHNSAIFWIIDHLTQVIVDRKIPIKVPIELERNKIYSNQSMNKVVIELVMLQKINENMKKDIVNLLNRVIKICNKQNIYNELIQPRGDDNYVSVGPVNDNVSSGGAGRVQLVKKKGDPNTVYARKEFYIKKADTVERSVGDIFQHFLEEVHNLLVVEKELVHTLDPFKIDQTDPFDNFFKEWKVFNFTYRPNNHYNAIIDAYWICYDEELRFKPRFFIVLNYCGDTLGNLLRKIQKREEQMSLYSIVSIVHGAVSCVHHLHSYHRSVHGDIKPDNIAFTMNGENISVRLIDLGGLAHVGDKGMWQTEKYRDKRSRSTSFRVDIFALGKVMAECVTCICETHPEESNKISKHLYEWILRACNIGNRTKFEDAANAARELEGITQTNVDDSVDVNMLRQAMNSLTEQQDCPIEESNFLFYYDTII